MAKRILTPEEKSQILKERCSEAMTAHPNNMIFVRVEDETDENGEAIVWVHFDRDAQSMFRVIRKRCTNSSLAPAQCSSLRNSTAPRSATRAFNS
jgi:hypothetical protein